MQSVQTKGTTDMSTLETEIKADGRHIAAQIEKARKYEEAAEEKAGTDLRKAADHWTSVYERIAAAKAKCKEAKVSFTEFKEQYCQGLGGKSKLYKILAIADGRTTVEKEQERDAKRQASKRAKDKSVRDVTNSSPPNGHAVQTDGVSEAVEKQVEGVIANLPSSWEETAEESAGTRTVADAPTDASDVVVVMEPQIPLVTDHALDDEQKPGNDPLGEFKRACNKWLPLMIEAERQKARVYVNTWKPKPVKRKVAA
jgi:hypothetical protein